MTVSGLPKHRRCRAAERGGQGVSVYRGPAGQGARGGIMPFSSSHQRWEILTACTGRSLHRLSDTRWSARVDSVKLIAAHLPGITKALERVQELSLTPETCSDVHGLKFYLNSFESILMSSLWLKILTVVNHRSLVLQARLTLKRPISLISLKI